MSSERERIIAEATTMDALFATHGWQRSPKPMLDAAVFEHGNRRIHLASQDDHHFFIHAQQIKPFRVVIAETPFVGTPLDAAKHGVCLAQQLDHLQDPKIYNTCAEQAGLTPLRFRRAER
jgi:hypothetical protein